MSEAASNNSGKEADSSDTETSKQGNLTSAAAATVAKEATEAKPSEGNKQALHAPEQNKSESNLENIQHSKVESKPAKPESIPPSQPRVPIIKPPKMAANNDSSPKAKKAQKTRQVQLEPPEDADTIQDYEEQDEELEESEPSEALVVLMKVGTVALGLLLHLGRLLFNLLVGCLRLIAGLLPLTVHMAVFCTLLYVLAEYVVSPLPTYVDFVGRLRYVVRCLAWTLLPAVIGYVVSRWKRTEAHRRFADETFRLVAMLGVNSAVFTTYAPAECMHYVWLLHVLVAIYSCCYWLSLLHGGNFSRKSFSQPPLAALFLLMSWNFWNITTQDLGLGQPAVLDGPPAEPHKDSRGLTYWQHATMCEMVERVFCTVDESHRIFYQ